MKDIVIIGAGIVGLATAYDLWKRNPGLSITILEKEKKIASHQTGHNSGVIHSGIYYKPGSSRAVFCKKGYDKLLAFCNEKQIPYDICGKHIVAVNENELVRLKQIHERGLLNGLEGVREVTIEEAKEKEPHIHGLGALWVPQAGIIRFADVAAKMAQILIREGVPILFETTLTAIKEKKDSIDCVTNNGTIESKWLINCAGLYSDKVACMNIPDLAVKIIPFRGEFYKLIPRKEYLVKNLIYPVPNPDFPFLGVHFTRKLNGGIEAGPNAVLALGKESYSNFEVNREELQEIIGFKGFQILAKKYWREGLGEIKRSLNKASFVKELQKLIPEIKESDLIEGGSGVRAMACDKKGNLIDDFLVVKQNRCIHVLNAPSPAATASLAIGEEIATLALKNMD